MTMYPLKLRSGMQSVEERMHHTSVKELRNNLYAKKERQLTYSANQVMLGAATPDLAGPVTSLDFSTSKRIGLIAGQGAGKTNILHLIASQLAKIGKHSIAFLSDYKNEVKKTLPYPLQSHLQDRLPPGMQAFGVPVRAFLPYVTKKSSMSFQNGYVANVDGFMQYPIDEMSIIDIFTLAGMKGNDTRETRAKVSVLFDRCGKDLDALQGFLEDKEDEDESGFELQPRERSKVLFALSQLTEVGLCGDKYAVNIAKELEAKNIVSIDFEKFEEIEGSFLQAVCAVETRRLLNFKKPLLLIYDEAHTVAPKGQETSSKAAIQFYINVGRSISKSVIFASQTITGQGALCPSLLKQLNCLLVSYKTSKADIEQLVNFVSLSPEEKYRLKYLSAHPSLKTGEWGLIDFGKPEGHRLSQFYPFINPCRILEERRV